MPSQGVKKPCNQCIFNLIDHVIPLSNPLKINFHLELFLTCTFIIRFHKPLKPFSEHDAKGNGILQVTMITSKLGLTF